MHNQGSRRLPLFWTPAVVAGCRLTLENDMERFFTFWSHYMDIPPDAREYIFDHARINRYRPKVFSYPDDPKPYWCFVLDGLAANVYDTVNRHGIIRYLITPNAHFTGTEHPFTKKGGDIYIELLKPTTLFMLRNNFALEAQQRFTAVSELFHILKQHQINNLRKHLQVFQQRRIVDKYRYMAEQLPDVIKHTNNRQQARFLQISESSLYEAKKSYLFESLRHK